METIEEYLVRDPWKGRRGPMVLARKHFIPGPYQVVENRERARELIAEDNAFAPGREDAFGYGDSVVAYVIYKTTRKWKLLCLARDRMESKHLVVTPKIQATIKHLETFLAYVGLDPQKNGINLND